jgi:hypothetical protein
MLILVLAFTFLPEDLLDLGCKRLDIRFGEAINEIGLSANHCRLDFLQFVDFEIFELFVTEVD